MFSGTSNIFRLTLDQTTEKTFYVISLKFSVHYNTQNNSIKPVLTNLYHKIIILVNPYPISFKNVDYSLLPILKN